MVSHIDNPWAHNGLGFAYRNGAGTKCVAPTLDDILSPFDRPLTLLFFNIVYFLIKYFLGGTNRDYDKSFEFYTKAAEQGNSIAINNIGTCYFYGYGCDQNFSKAFQWYEKSAHLCHSEAMFNVGVCYENGDGKEILAYFGRYYFSFRPTFDTSVFNIVYFTLNILGVTKDLTKAKQWYMKAAAQGDEDAQKELDKLIAYLLQGRSHCSRAVHT